MPRTTRTQQGSRKRLPARACEEPPSPVHSFLHPPAASPALQAGKHHPYIVTRNYTLLATCGVSCCQDVHVNFLVRHSHCGNRISHYGRFDLRHWLLYDPYPPKTHYGNASESENYGRQRPNARSRHAIIQTIFKSASDRSQGSGCARKEISRVFIAPQARRWADCCGLLRTFASAVGHFPVSSVS